MEYFCSTRLPTECVGVVARYPYCMIRTLLPLAPHFLKKGTYKYNISRRSLQQLTKHPNRPACSYYCPRAWFNAGHSSDREGTIRCKPSPSTCRPFPTRGGRHIRTPTPSSSAARGTAALLSLGPVLRSLRTKPSPREPPQRGRRRGRLSSGTFRYNSRVLPDQTVQQALV